MTQIVLDLYVFFITNKIKSKKIAFAIIPKEVKYNLHYDDVRGDFFRPSCGTTLLNVLL